MRNLLELFALSGAVASRNAPRAACDSTVTVNDLALTLASSASSTDIRGSFFTLQPSGVVCQASNFTLPSTWLYCDDKKEWMYILYQAPAAVGGYDLHLTHNLNSSAGSTQIRWESGVLHFRLNGPIPILLDQVGGAATTLVSGPAP